MDKKTIVAFVLITFFMAIFMNMQSKQSTANSVQPVEATAPDAVLDEGGVESTTVTYASLPRLDEATAETHIVETERYTITFNTYGAIISSLTLKDFNEADGRPVEMMLGDRFASSGAVAGAFLLYLGGNNQGDAFYGPFSFKDEGEHHYSFTAQSAVQQGDKTIPFIIVKHFRFLPDEYMFNVTVELIQPDGDYLPLNFSGFSYTLEGMSQIGPLFEKMDGRDVFRKNSYLIDDRRREVTIKNGVYINNDRVTWAAVSEKYFAFIGVPDESPYRQLWTDKSIMVTIEGEERPMLGRQLAFSRSQIKNARNLDSFFFYVGPKQENILKLYDNANNNGFRLSNLKLGKAMDEARILYPVEWLLKEMLKIAYSLVPNWGWAILLVTLVVKLALMPLTIKSMLSTSRMADLAPKLKILQAQYKDNPQAMQQAQMKLYKDEGVNPMAGCLPILLQMPILLAMYGLFNKYFEFRGAAFFGWITDLSSPDAIYTFANPIPLLGWNAVRLLPVIYVLSQFLMNKVTQQEQTMQNDQMKMMMNVMPIMFFFILYNMPSGLLVYWIASNLFSVVQQLFINRLKRKLRLAAGTKASPATVVKKKR